MAVMGAAQLAGVMSIVGRAAAASRGGRSTPAPTGVRTEQIEAQIDAESHAFRSAGGSTTMGSSIRGTPAPCSASRCPPSTPLSSPAAAASASSGM